jgi:predicted nucleic acid-binding protein
MTVVTDTSVILNLCWLGEQELLAGLFGEVLAPREVRVEFENLAASDPRFTGLAFPSWVKVKPISGIAPGLADETGLDPGELAALSLALERGISDVLIDERAARAVAVSRALRPVGTLGILIRSKAKGLLPAVMPRIHRLKNEADFWIGEELLDHIARITGE